VEIEMVAHSVANPLSLSFTDTPGSFCHNDTHTHNDKHCRDTGCDETSDPDNGCENCLDLLISYEHSLTGNNTSAIHPYFKVTTTLPVTSLHPDPMVYRNKQVQPPDIIFKDISNESIILII
jgi:hypothetical protein